MKVSELIPTAEQQLIFDEFENHRVMKINAYAGAAKTTTLVMLAERNVKPSLYITFNVAMSNEAKGKFPRHVEVRTSHSLAYATIGNKYQHKLSRPSGAYKNVCGTGAEVARYFRIQPVQGSESNIPAAVIGYDVIDTVNRFEHSEDAKMNKSHVSIKGSRKMQKDPAFIRNNYVNLVLRHAKTLWDLRVNIDSDILCGHDTYMKLYQMLQPDLSRYDTIYLDEAQDSNPCLLSILNNQTKCKVVYVGDTHQAIYQFRGATNAMDKIDAPMYELSKSFRFGTPLANAASKMIFGMNGRILGNDLVSTTIGVEDDVVLKEKHTRIYRTNAMLIDDAIDLLEQGKKILITINRNAFISLLNSGQALHDGRLKDVKHRDLMYYISWGELRSIIEVAQLPELRRIVNIVEAGRTERVIAALESYKEPRSPDIILSTAHGVKGLEFDNVYLADDFVVPDKEDPSDDIRSYLSDAELNLIYVAATRASKTIRFNSLVKELIYKN